MTAACILAKWAFGLMAGFVVCVFVAWAFGPSALLALLILVGGVGVVVWLYRKSAWVKDEEIVRESQELAEFKKRFNEKEAERAERRRGIA